MRKILLLLAFVSFIGMQAFAQNTITGIVTDASGEPVPGANVRVKGYSDVGTITDLNGAYSLNVPTEATTLVFSFVGLKTTEVEISGQPKVNFKFETEDQTVDEVVIVAYGQTTKQAFTGSAAVVESKELEKRQVSNVSGALSGVTPGLQALSNDGQPGTSTKIRIRGIGSFNSSSEPLYVVDGVPYDGDISAISGSDIESVTVMKDAASNSLYGARGANGVIMITTKKGKAGQTTITFDAKVGINQRGVPEYDIMTEPSMYYEKFYEGAYNYHFNAGLTAEEANIAANNTMFGDQGLEYNIYTVPSGQMLIGTDGRINPNATLGRVWADDYYLINDNWYNEIFKKSQIRQEYNLSISGGSDKQSTYFSVNYLDDEGIISNSSFNRLSTRLKTDYQATKWLKVGGNIGFTNSMSNYPDDQSGLSSKNLFYVTRIVAPIYPLYVRDASGNIMVDDKIGIQLFDYGTGEYPGLTRPVMSIANPASDLQLDKRTYKSNILSAKGYMNFDFVKGLKLQLIASYDYDNTNGMSKNNAYYGQSADYGGSIYRYGQTTGSIVLQQLLTYTRSFGGHNLTALVGHETYSRKWNYVDGYKQNIYDPESEEISSGILSPQTSSSTHEYFVEGYLTRLQYDYNQKYFLSASYRRDGSSRFYKDNRWGNFWSVGASWLINEESFMESMSWINMLKLKASYGAQGNDALMDQQGNQNYYPYLDQFEVYNNNNVFGIRETYIGNKDITWETSYNLNIGTEFSLFNDRLSGSLEFFNRKVKDMLFYVQIPPSVGYSSAPANIGSMRNMGFEFDLRGVVLRTDKLEWSVYLNGTHYKNEILDLPDYMEERENGYPSGTKVWKVGGSMYDWFMPIYAGVNEEGSPMWNIKNEDGSTGTTTSYATASLYDNKGKPGTSLPDLQGGFGTSLSAYGIDFSIGITYQLGGLTFDSPYQDLMHAGEASEAGTNWHKDILNSWTPENTNTNIPRVDFGAVDFNATSDRFLISSSFLSINNITLGYTFPKSITNKLKLNVLRLYVSSDNTALFSKRKGLDPRQNYNGNTDYIYSPIRVITGGLKIQF